eukprot:CAMPEP_0119547246 /NCGR_PEP_ID=MMETSP1352-20130426/1408_1 /TAXON_ID=265584 /ORGANISM="Stauroneis constricta, Strain CCMP1120" /LENGTH=70 /DNA_ID=CAMNT_0007592107 /DNA_START=83 /DNA_END=292 /DNA_ORIENTATION=+
MIRRIAVIMYVVYLEWNCDDDTGTSSSSNSCNWNSGCWADVNEDSSVAGVFVFFFENTLGALACASQQSQ